MGGILSSRWLKSDVHDAPTPTTKWGQVVVFSADIRFVFHFAIRFDVVRVYDRHIGIFRLVIIQANCYAHIK